jgi:hypothetical protein
VSEESRTFEPGFDFRLTCGFEETFNSFLKVLDGFVYGFSLAGNIKLGTKSYVTARVLGVQNRAQRNGRHSLINTI